MLFFFLDKKMGLRYHEHRIQIDCAEGTIMAWAKNLNWDIFYQTPEGLCEAYLERLNIEREKPTRAYLDRLVRAHQMTIPFETLDVTDFSVPISLEPAAIMDKLLTRKRGGYCFELNGLFFLFLRALGFDAWMCPCRQLRHKETYPVPIAHCGVLVYLDGKELFCDVGYGGPAPRGTLELTSEEVQTVENESFFFQKAPLTPYDAQFCCYQPGWYTLTRKRGEKPDMLLIQVAPIQCYLHDFYGASMSRSMGDSAFAARHVALMAPEGFVDFAGNVLEIRKGDIRTRETIEEQDVPDLLLHYFGVDCRKEFAKQYK